MSRSVDPRWTGHVNRVFADNLEELLAAAEAVESLLTHPGWTHLSRLLDAEAEQVSAVTDGRLLESRADYAFAHGRMGGIRSITLAAEAILERAQHKLAEQQSKHEGARDRVPVEV